MTDQFERTVRIRDDKIPESLLTSHSGRIIWWGDSLTEQGPPAVLAAGLTGVTVTNAGVGGEPSVTIAARQGAAPLQLLPVGGSIPASGGVTVTIEAGGWPLLRAPGSAGGTVAGVPGTLSITKQTPGSLVHEDGDVYTFTRTNPGADVPVTRPRPFVFTQSVEHRDSTVVIWAGRNNLGDPDRVVADVDAMVQHLSPANPRFLVLGVIAGGSDNESAKTNIAAINKRLSRYGARFVDVLGYLVRWGLADSGIASPTGQDAVDVAAGIVPTSLRTDGIHLNNSGRAVVANIVGQRFHDLGWYAYVRQSVPQITTVPVFTDTFDSVTGWEGANGGVITHIASDGADTPGGCMEAVLTTATNSGCRTKATDVAIGAGRPFTVTANVKRTAGTAVPRMLCHWYGAAGAYIGNTPLPFDNVVDNVWKAGLRNNASTPAGTETVRFELNKAGTDSTAATFRLDDVRLTV